MTFAEKIKQTRRKLYLSQAALAKAVGVSFASINRWENGIREPNLVQETKFLDFCKAQGITFEE